MPQMTWSDTSPRHGFAYNRVPTHRGSVWGGSCVTHYHEEYGPILDSVFEMTCDVVDANGVAPDDAIRQVIKDEGWTVLPTHQRAILARVRSRQ